MSDARADCIFCRIIAGDLPSTMVHQDEAVVAFRDIHPAAPVHVLVVPRRHIPSVETVSDEDAPLMGRLLTVARAVARAEGLSTRGYRLVINTGPEAGQSVHHLHLHLLGGRQLRWPAG